MHSFVVSTTTLVNSYNGIFTDIQESRADNCIFFFGETTSPSGDILQDRWWFPMRLPWCLFFQINNRCIGGVSPSLIANPIMSTQLGQISNIYENYLVIQKEIQTKKILGNIHADSPDSLEVDGQYLQQDHKPTGHYRSVGSPSLPKHS